MERRVRALLRRAPAGNRRELLTEALTYLFVLRRQNLRAPVTIAYLEAFRAIRPGGDPDAVRDLAGSLAVKLDRGAEEAAGRASEAFAAVTADTVEDHEHEAVTAYEDAAGRRWALGAYAAMATSTIGRQATTLGLVDALGDRLVVVEGSSTDAICGPLIGNTYPAAAAPQPPFHAGCNCALAAAS
ncbi:MAG: hypothetical protein EDQ89_00215 [Acidobacteria bacterium]|nr:MAG: hypothetical protein EDQ89_00215 [Acidobacteriota bacterium]